MSSRKLQRGPMYFLLEHMDVSVTVDDLSSW